MPRLLVELRGRLRQADSGALVGLPQHRISRAEQGRYPLTPDEADRYARALGATPVQRRRLVALAAAHTTDSIGGRKHLLRNAHQVQRRIGDLETANKLIRSWVPDVVTGVLQTREYTLALVSEQIDVTNDERWWAPRRARLALLDDPEREFRLLLGEAALRWGIGSAEVMAAQIEHLITMSRRPNIQLGLVPLDVVHPIAMPRGFQLYGASTASVATEVGTAFVSQPDVDLFVEDFARLESIAVSGESMRAMLDQIAQIYRPA